MEEEQAPLKRKRDRNRRKKLRKYLKEFRRQKLQKLRKRKPEIPGPCLPDFDIIDPVEEAKYVKQVQESRGFDVDSFFLPYGGIRPYRVDYTHVVMGKVAVECYNYDKGKKLVFNGVVKANILGCSLVSFYYITLEARDPENNDALVTIQTRCHDSSPVENEDFRLNLIIESCSIKGSGEHKDESCWDPTAVDKFYTGVMPDWIEDGALTGSKKLQYYEVKESEWEENDWLYHYMEAAAFSKWDSTMVDQMPLVLKKVVVQTKEEDAELSMSKWKLKASNAIFFITFMVRGGAEYRGIIRKTRDGRPQHLRLEAVCEMAKAN